MGQQSALEREFAMRAKQFQLPPWEEEYRFASPRRFRFDFAFVPQKVAVELDGGNFSGGRHVRGTGYEKDCEKGNLAIELGWVVLHYTGKQLRKDPIRVGRQVLQVLEMRRACAES